jgi:hypothetical protein
MSFCFLSWKKTQPTQGEKNLYGSYQIHQPTGRESILSGEKILSVLQNNRRGPLPSIISANYIAVLQKGVWNHIPGKVGTLVLNWGHALLRVFTCRE